MPAYDLLGEYMLVFNKSGRSASYQYHYHFDISDEDLEKQAKGHQHHHDLTKGGIVWSFIYGLVE